MAEREFMYENIESSQETENEIVRLKQNVILRVLYFYIIFCIACRIHDYFFWYILLFLYKYIHRKVCKKKIKETEFSTHTFIFYTSPKINITSIRTYDRKATSTAVIFSLLFIEIIALYTL